MTSLFLRELKITVTAQSVSGKRGGLMISSLDSRSSGLG